MGYLVAILITFFVTMFGVSAVRKRRADLSDGKLMFRAGCWPAIVATIAFLLSIGVMGRDPSAGLGMMVALLITPFVAGFVFIVGLAGGLFGLIVAKRK